MAWLVFGLFFLASDHAPWWVYVVFLLGHGIDVAQQANETWLASHDHDEMMEQLRKLNGEDGGW